jgi:hypothetical protein
MLGERKRPVFSKAAEPDKCFLTLLYFAFFSPKINEKVEHGYWLPELKPSTTIVARNLLIDLENVERGFGYISSLSTRVGRSISASLRNPCLLQNTFCIFFSFFLANI